jgi:hypothetical protein
VIYQQAVRSWTEHLRSGGTIGWRDWLTVGDTAADVPPGWTTPGAAQLEFVRRVAARRALAGEALAELADLVTSRSGPGRGLGQQPLSWPADDGLPTGPRLGAPPVDPADVPDEELVRVGVGALTELLLGSTADADDPGQPSATRRPFTRTPAFRLAGAPVTTSAVRRALGAAGHAEGGRSPRVVLLAEPFDYALAQVWSSRVQHGAPVRWHGFLVRWSGRRDLPPSADLPALAREWAGRSAQVHVVVAPGGFEAATRVAADVIGVHLSPGRWRRRPPAPQPGVRDLAPAAVDVARRVNAVLGVRVGEERHAVALRRLVRTLARPTPSGHALTVPVPHRDWARSRAARLAEELSAGGYPVHGPLDGLAPRFDALPTHPRRTDALEVVVTACLDLALTGRDGP